MISRDKLVNVRRLNPWYRRTLQTLDGDWVLRNGWFFWVERGRKELG